MFRKEALIMLSENITESWLDDKINDCITKITQNMHKFGDDFPSACTTNGVYRRKQNDDWTNGFWTGMLCLVYEITKDPAFLEQAKKNALSFQRRLDEHFVLDHHDIGFLYSLSAGALYNIEPQNESYAAQLTQAGEKLAQRFQQNGQFIQAWGKMGAAAEYRLIIDSLLNLPLLYRSAQINEKEQLREIANNHYATVLENIVKPDGATYHTYYFDTQTGQPLYGITRQGHRDDSTWARGQSWALLGIPLIERIRQSTADKALYKQIADYFLTQLPKDFIPYWDFDFSDVNPSYKDSSAASIAVCGLLEAAKQDLYPDAQSLAKGMLYQLGTCYLDTDPQHDGLLAHSVYSYHDNKGLDESTLWGDYFFLEALYRVKNKQWQQYW